ncbi:MAG: T9SS C-terminal target domain-containing protein [Crocinitomix sp.]|nr:T9SS C-terminal target domain-containing protein [Crocinitomix sp.]
MKKLLLSILVLGLANGMYALKWEGHHGPLVDSDTDSRAAGCSPANEKIFMEFNNVRALVETGGSLWQDRSNSNPSYEYPKGSENHLIYSGALWMGGEDINGQLKLAAHMFRQGNDFWSGPLGDLIEGTGNYNPFVPQNADATLIRDYGAAEIFPDVCTEYDNFFSIRKAEVKQFISWWKCENGISEPEDCEEVVRPSEETLEKIRNWPAHGDESLGQDFYLAPFYDNTKEGETPNGIYDPMNDGDYPWYDFEEEIDCRNDRRVTLFGDETHWWVFNDKGNIHTESGGDPIGMEIRAQAFSFATDDEINDMTFYNYELINRGTQTLYETYFGQWVDSDVGLANDDYVGCDVGRGLGYAYNGDLNDEGGAGGQPGYGANIPAVGVDFFEGPYLDNDNIDNPLYKAVSDDAGPAVLLPEVFAGKGIPYPGLGIGYGDGVVDNERFGMQRFVYHDIGAGPYADPNSAADFYNYLRGIWKNGSNMQFGGNGNTSGSGIPTKFMFPDDSDPLGWGTYPSALPTTDPWSEISDNNPVGDRRFLQSAGPFILRPGAVNNITVGVVIGQSSESDLEAPVRALKTADTKAQALFDNCFELVDPPVAPLLTIQEMENQLILFLSDPAGIDPLEEYTEEDNINIITPDELIEMGIFYDNIFRFEGFQVYQMADELASITELANLSKARLVAQSDLENGIGKLVNYTYDEELDISIPAVMVEPVGSNDLDEGLRRSFSVTEDLFATGDRTLVNHKKYYYLAVSYAYNQYKEYDPNDPTLLDGQKNPYLRSRISATGAGIESVVGIPHDPSPEADGRVFTTSYGFQPEITQIEGEGNGGEFLELTAGTVTDILANNSVKHPTYQSGSGPIDIKVVDPLNLKGGAYTLGFNNTISDIDETTWWLAKLADGESDTVFSYGAIDVVREQLILNWGISVQINQQYYTNAGVNAYTEPIGATIDFADSSAMWLSFIQDDDSFYPSNWIRVGNSEEANNHATDPNVNCIPESWIYQPCHYDDGGIDAENQLYEQMLEGGIAPFKFVAKAPYGSPFGFPNDNTNTPWYEGTIETWFSTASSLQNQISMVDLHSVDIILTDDQSKWTRCPVLEINNIIVQTEHGDQVITPRSDASVGKDGLPDGDGTGMGWFPGYAIDVITGTRLNMAFSENSWLKGDNGDDMIWNPTSSFNDNSGAPLFGGMHYVYVFGADVDGDGTAYDGGSWLRTMWEVNGAGNGDNGDYLESWKTCMWVMEPRLTFGQELLATDVKISARINKPYEEREVDLENEGYPLYRFSFDNPSEVGDGDRLTSVLDNINIVPNPYYAYSEYETGKRDNRVKITNLPERCEVTIFNMQGALVRNYVKDDPLTSIDWDLKNHQSIPIAGGMYIVHVTIEIPDESGNIVEHEKILKWYGVLRQPDLDNL